MRVRCTGGRALAAAVLTAVMVATTGLAPADRKDGELPFYGQEIEWEPCFTAEELAEADPTEGDPDWTSRLECGTLTVPVNHGDTDGETIDLAVIRHPAQGPAEARQGSLVFNFGGPGGPGVEPMRSGPLAVGKEVRDSFDLVSFDPRGVGRSEGFICPGWRSMERPLADVRGVEPADVTDAQLRALAEGARDHARSCVEEAGEEFLANMGTVNVVRDLDLLRDGLGDGELSYVGFSYGTYIGTLYAEMFADRTRAMVLDGAVQVERDAIADGVEQAEGAQTAWEVFVGYCLDGAPECPFTSADAATAEMEEILAALDADPLAIAGQKVDRDALLSLLRRSLQGEQNWPNDARLLARMAEGESDDEFVQNYLKGPLAREDARPGAEESAFAAVQCADHANPDEPGAYRDGAQRAAEGSPLFGGDGVWPFLPCAYWPDTEIAPTGLTAPMAPPLLVVGTRGDPATPYAWSEELAGQLTSATLFTYEGGGHTAYAGGRSCVDGVVDAYLLRGEIPAEDASCPSEL
ncbi:alpha/beta hydrolase [Nocardiopsis oceani]